jgi:chromosome partitioning protein
LDDVGPTRRVNEQVVPRVSTADPRIIVFGNEKGGAGKSTLAIHVACGLLHDSFTVSVIDLDMRQQSLNHFFAHRTAWAGAAGVVLPMPVSGLEDPAALIGLDDAEAARRLTEMIEVAAARSDYVVIDTPGADTLVSRVAHRNAELIVTPMNDSFVDFDMLGAVDPVTLELLRPSLYAEVVWESRKQRMMGARKAIDWLLLRNRLATTEARNRRRLDERLQALSKRVGFRLGPGLRDRVIYRELFPFGLTVADLSPTVRPVPVSLTHVAARQELRSVLGAMGVAGHSPAPENEMDGALAEAS